MIDDLAVLVANYLSGTTDPTVSVNALIPTVSLRANDQMPPLIKAVYDDVRTARIIEGDEPDATPCLVVTVSTDIVIRLLGGQPVAPADSAPNAPVVVAVSYVAAFGDLPKARADAGYTMKAVRRCLGALGTTATADQKTLNATRLIQIRRVVERRLFASKGASALLGIVLAQCTVRDLAP